MTLSGNADSRTTWGVIERIRPVTWEIMIVAGDIIRLSVTSVITALVETRTVIGPPGESGGVEVGVGHGWTFEIGIVKAMVFEEVQYSPKLEEFFEGEDRRFNNGYPS